MITPDTHVTLWLYYEGMRCHDYDEWMGPLRQFFEDFNLYEGGIGNRAVLNQEAHEIMDRLEKVGIYFSGGGQALILEIRVTKS